MSSVKRLTDRQINSSDRYYMNCSKTCIFEFDCQENCDCEELDQLIDRLGRIEDILGDEYDLGRLRELVEEEREDRCLTPLTQADIDMMHFERVWIDYGAGGEDGVILYGKLYSIDTLDGAGIKELLLDATGHGGESLDNPSGEYTIYRRQKTGPGQESARTLEAGGGHGG